MLTEKHPRPSFEISPDTRFLVDAFIAAGVGDTVTFETLSRTIGRPLTGGDPKIQRALKVCLNEHGAVYASVRGVGYKRLESRDILKASEHDLKRIGRAAKRSGRKLSTADVTKLNNDERGLMFARMSGLALIAHSAKEKTVQKLADDAASKGGQLAISQTLDALKKGEL